MLLESFGKLGSAWLEHANQKSTTCPLIKVLYFSSPDKRRLRGQRFQNNKFKLRP